MTSDGQHLRHLLATSFLTKNSNKFFISFLFHKMIGVSVGGILLPKIPEEAYACRTAMYTVLVIDIGASAF